MCTQSKPAHKAKKWKTENYFLQFCKLFVGFGIFLQNFKRKIPNYKIDFQTPFHLQTKKIYRNCSKQIVRMVKKCKNGKKCLTFPKVLPDFKKIWLIK